MKFKICIFITFFTYSMSLTTPIKLLLGAALTNAHFEFRKQQYIETFNQLKNFGYHNFYIVEALKKQGPTFLDNYCNNVFYSTANNPHFKNNGTNEARTLLQGSYYFNFNPEDMIIKLTGRYELISDYFLKTVELYANQYDAFVKVNDHGDVYTLAFAMKYKYFKEMYETMDFNNMERNWINVETEVGNYIKKKVREGNFKVFCMDKLDIKANLLGSSCAPGAEGILIF